MSEVVKGRRCRRVALLAATSAVCWTGVAQADAAPDANTLSGVTVTAQAREQESKASYKVTGSTTGMRTDTALIDVPQAVTVVSIKQINDQAAGSIGEAIRYVPGVFSAQGEGNRETLVFRGNATTGDFFVDGVRDDVQTYRDLYNIERLEIFRGPNAMIFGRGGIGGVVNRVTKVASWQPVGELHFEAGSYDHKRISGDVGLPVNDRVALRITGVYQDSGSYRDGVENERWGVNPTASFRIGDATNVQIGYEHFEDDRIADRGVPAQVRGAGMAVAKPLKTPRGQFFGDPANSPTWTDTDAANLFIEHTFSDNVSIRNRTRWANYDKFYQNVFPGDVNAAQTTVSLSAYNNATARKNFINQTDLNLTFNTGAIEHLLLVGAEYGRQITDNRRFEGRFAGNAASVTVPISASNVRLPLTWTQTASSGDNKGVATVKAGYVQDQIGLTGALKLVLGVRYEDFRTRVTDRRVVGFPAGQQRQFDVTDTLWSPRVGVIWKPVENASIYAGYSKTYQPRGGDQLTSLSISNQNLDPETFQNYELGAKWDINPSFNVTAAVFQLDRDNVLALSDPNNAASPTVPIGKQRTRGMELSAAGELTEQLSFVAAYTLSNGEFLDNVSGTVRAGNKLPNVPKSSASLWSRYEVTPKLGVALGAIYQGKRYASTDNVVVMPGFTRLDAAAFYDVTDRITAQVNVENLLDKRYFVYANSNNNITPGSPTAVKVGLTARF
ncbi:MULTISPECIES: TonB-dependent siderophore receptor [Phenylobacterium]|jgi:catecholate siderophore receptor|uniref:Catecholate siderophore receptor n=1 Tax=Phenylobacterium haematophilum TaxID=98513 RepID=A0A840A244_9CAUL|nr:MULTISPECIES: TonB-dependent siderophore receptor [Phenylobacterium]MBB3893025.1 catecholate siderophore receptor [Phenylobacterium haematophilum]